MIYATVTEHAVRFLLSLRYAILWKRSETFCIPPPITVVGHVPSERRATFFLFLRSRLSRNPVPSPRTGAHLLFPLRAVTDIIRTHVRSSPLSRTVFSALHRCPSSSHPSPLTTTGVPYRTKPLFRPAFSFYTFSQFHRFTLQSADATALRHSYQSAIDFVPECFFELFCYLLLFNNIRKPRRDLGELLYYIVTTQHPSVCSSWF